MPTGMEEGGKMPAVIVVGLQFGDEGKGKVVDFYASDADMVVRFQGGANAGHTVIVNGGTYKFHLLPSGSLQKKQLVIGNGVVIDPVILFQEIKSLEAQGIPINLRISDRAHVVFPFHKEIDGIEETLKGSWSAGTTRMGIGPTYSDKFARFGIRIHDLLSKAILMQKLEKLLTIRESLLKEHPNCDEKISLEKLVDTYLEYGRKLQKFITDTSFKVNEALATKKKVLFEGAQGALLDIDFGIYPFGTSSNTIAGGACTGVGVAPTKIDGILGVLKAYTSRVGTGYFPSELKNNIGDRIREKGNEFGTTTGRPRRCGWLDLFAVNYAVRLNAPNGLAITKLDVLGGLEPVKICTDYMLNGENIEHFPANSVLLKECQPIYEEFEGWPDLKPEEWWAIAKQGYDTLPKQVIRYLERISEFLNVPIHLISVGGVRGATICLKKIFFNS
ncbi:MAG: adenylosuccinate synthase [Candidatus Hodarchaeota archaeon]